MGSLINPKPWVPYLNVKDCSQGFCSLYCSQWCYTISPPPPPIELPNENQSPNFSPLIIAIILILVTGFLIVSYYAIILKYFGNNHSSTPRVDHDTDEDTLSLEPWHVANDGLNEALIKSIAVYNYKKGHKLIEGTDCSVCLSEFEEDESLRLLPNCNHAFHVACIDTWLSSHSNCPLCRANIVHIQPLPPPALENEAIIEDINTGAIRGEEILHNGEISKEKNKEVVIEIRDETFIHVRRSLSMGFDCGERLSIGDVLLLNHDSSRNDGVGSSKGKLISEISKLSKGAMGLCVDNPVLMKRSFSSERFPFPRRGKHLIMMNP